MKLILIWIRSGVRIKDMGESSTVFLSGQELEKVPFNPLLKHRVDVRLYY